MRYKNMSVHFIKRHFGLRYKPICKGTIDQDECFKVFKTFKKNKSS